MTRLYEFLPQVKQAVTLASAKALTCLPASFRVGKMAIKIFGTLILLTCSACIFDSSRDTEIVKGGTAFIMSWYAPETTVDNEKLNPYTELDHYELFINATGFFSEDDDPAVFISAVKNSKLITQFDLALINTDELPASPELYVSLKAVGIDGQKSDFMAPIIWNRL